MWSRRFREKEDVGGICGIPLLQTCWAGFRVIKIPPLLSSLLLSEATVSAPSDMLAHVHLHSLASSLPPPLFLSALVISLLQSTQLSLWVRKFLLWLPCDSLSVAPFLDKRSSVLSFLHPHVITMNSLWQHTARYSSLIFVFFHLPPPLLPPTLHFFPSTYLPLLGVQWSV